LLGPTIDRFEEAFAEVVGAPYAAAVSSGTAGLHLLCVLAGVGPGDEVITSPYSFVASANCAVYEGATPVFADIDPKTLNLSPPAVEAAITKRTRAVVAVDIYGYPCELDELRALCEARGIALIQDACEALGARYKGAPVGSHGTSAVFAFYPNKQMTTGEGGMVATHSEREWRLLRSLRNQGRADSGGWLEHARLGFNYRLDDIGAAIGLGQLEKLDAILEARAGVAARYGELLADVPGLELPCADDAEHERSWFVYVVTLPEDADREAVISSLVEKGLVREAGRDKNNGNAILYGTTRAFLEKFGLRDLSGLPPLEEFAPDTATQQAIRERLSSRQLELADELEADSQDDDETLETID
jgi:perosamine synthetase